MASLSIVHTHLGAEPRGNQTTFARWQGMLERLGWSVRSMPIWDGEQCDVLLALHATKSRDSILRFRRAFPERPLIVAATGTDIYNDDQDPRLAHESFALATRIIVLQPLALAEIPLPHRERARVIYQSLNPSSVVPKRWDHEQRFDVAFLANARRVKDPLTALRAARLLGPKSRVRILHMGSSLDPELGVNLREEMAGLESFECLGSLPQSEALGLMAACPLALSTSRHEGGANIVTEALALGVPLLVSAIPGSIGLLGSEYPGLFPVGDAERLAQLLEQASAEPEFLASLKRACQAQAHIAAPALEFESLRALMAELET